MWQALKKLKLKLFGRGNKVTDVQMLYEKSSSKNERQEALQSRSKRLYEGNYSKRIGPTSSTYLSRPPSSAIREISTNIRDEEISYAYIEPRTPTKISRRVPGTRSPPRSIRSPRINLPPSSPNKKDQEIPSDTNMIHTRPSEKDTSMFEARKSIPIITTLRHNASKSTPLPFKRRRFSPVSSEILRFLRHSRPGTVSNPPPPVTLIVRKSLFKEIMRR